MVRVGSHCGKMWGFELAGHSIDTYQVPALLLGGYRATFTAAWS